jgi:hypothetical protein
MHVVGKPSGKHVYVEYHRALRYSVLSIAVRGGQNIRPKDDLLFQLVLLRAATTSFSRGRICQRSSGDLRCFADQILFRHRV